MQALRVRQAHRGGGEATPKLVSGTAPSTARSSSPSVDSQRHAMTLRLPTWAPGSLDNDRLRGGMVNELLTLSPADGASVMHIALRAWS